MMPRSMASALAVVALVVAGLLAGVAFAQRGGTQLSDPDNRVSFVLPAGWNVEGIGNGTHFTRAQWPTVKSILLVDVEPATPGLTVEQEIDGRRSIHTQQNQVEDSSRQRRANGFQVWEGVYRGNINGDDVVIHDVLLFGDGVLANVMLTTYPDSYSQERGELNALVNSLVEL